MQLTGKLGLRPISRLSQTLGSLREAAMAPNVPNGFYSPVPQERVVALRATTTEQRRTLLDAFNWPIKSPGSLNAWLVFLGPSPGNSPSPIPWNYDPLPSIGRAHPGVSEYKDTQGYWDGIRKFARWIFPELAPHDAYAATMVRNLDPRHAAVSPRGAHMHFAASEAVNALNQVIRPVMVVALGGVRDYSDRAFTAWPGPQDSEAGSLFTSASRKERPWKTRTGRWSTGEAFLYVSASGIHPSLPHVSESDTRDFLVSQSQRARAL